MNKKNKPEELTDNELDQAAGGNFEEVKITYKKFGGDDGKNSGQPNRNTGKSGIVIFEEMETI